MALTETRHDSSADRSDSLGSPAGDDSPVAALDSLFGSGDHKVIGRLWLAFASVFLLAGTVIALLAAIEHSDLGGLDIVDDEAAFTQLWSLGRDLLLFGGVIPLLLGLAVYIVPLQVGSPSLAFPRGAAAAFGIWLVSTVLVIVSYTLGGGPAGWSSDHVLLWTLALGFTVLALTWGMICVASTVLGARTIGMDLHMVPVSAWGFLVFCLGGFFALPIVVAQLVLGYLDVKYGFLPDETTRGALVGVVDSVSLAPAIYWIGLPALAVGVETIAVHTGRPVRFHRSVLGLLGFLGIVAYGMDFFAFTASGRVIAFDNAVLVVALIVSVLPILGTLALAANSLKGGTIRVRTPLVAGLLSGVVLLAAAAASLLGVIWPLARFIESAFDTSVNLDDSLDLAGTSFHEGIWGLVIGAAVLGAIAGTHHWAHKMWGRALDDRLGLLTALAAAGGSVVWGIGGIVGGFLGQERLPTVGSDVADGVEALNAVGAIGLALLALASLLLAANIVKAASGRGSANEPWRGLTLEWSTSSPPPAGNFAAPPVVRSASPLADPGFLTADRTGPSSATVDETEHA